MKYLIYTIILFAFVASCAPDKPKKDHILIFSETKGFRHSSIEDGKDALWKVCEEKGFKVDTTENSAIMTTENLEKYAAVIFLCTTGDIFNEAEQSAFEGYIRNGGGYVGIHSAADTEYDWPWYGKLAGAYFESHPKQQEAVIQVLDKSHPAMKHLPDEWVKWDEWYNYKNLNPEVHVLANLDESSYEGGKNGKNHPIAWCQEYEGGKMFYTGLGHTEKSYTNPDFLKHVWGGIEYVIK
ncbi:MAG: ThuA domain-containing protein [Bacteroidota bacterium]